MSKLICSFYILFFFMLVAVPQDIAAQTFLSRVFKTSKLQNRKKIILQRRHHCGEMSAYNKKRAYKRHRPGVLKRMFSSSKSKPAVSRPVVPSQTPPQKSTAEKTPPPSVPVAEKSPIPANEPETTTVVKKKTPGWGRDSLKKMTESERRDTLLQMKPDIILTPLQFISDQDEFSVVNMDSFIQAMEYAQEGKVVLVEGHTDDLGSDAYNLNLSMKRAEKIRELLLSGGISDELISVIGYGESQPVVPNTSDKNRSINRRIEFKIFSLPE